MSEQTEKCAYCGDERPQKEMKRAKVLWHHTQKHMEKFRWYCADKCCAGKHQMSLEG